MCSHTCAVEACHSHTLIFYSKEIFTCCNKGKLAVKVSDCAKVSEPNTHKKAKCKSPASSFTFKMPCVVETCIFSLNHAGEF